MTYLCDSCALYPCGDSGVKMERRCPGYNPIPKPQTNADKIRSMTDEELATRLYLFTCVHVFDSKVKCEDNGCKKCWLDWMKEEVERGE